MFNICIPFLALGVFLAAVTSTEVAATEQSVILADKFEIVLQIFRHICLDSF